MQRGFVAECRYIASIFPGQLIQERRNYGPTVEGLGKGAVRSTLWVMPPVPRGKEPFVLKVPDCFETIPNFLGPRGDKTLKPVPCEEIVADLMQHWTGGLHNVPSGALPGVMEIVNSTPSKEERLQMRTQQTLYFEYWVLQGDAVAAQSKSALDVHGAIITPMMILAADWLGLRRKWADPSMARDSRPCPWCQETISDLAIICPNCNKQVQETPAELLKFSKPPAQPAA